MLLRPLNQKLDLKKRDIFEAESDEGNEDEKNEQVENQPKEDQQKKVETVKEYQEQRKSQQFFGKREQMGKHQEQARSKQTQLPQRQNFRNRAKGSKDTNEQENDPAPKTEEEIKRERRWKNDNKASIAHHNRKFLSMKKTGFL